VSDTWTEYPHTFTPHAPAGWFKYGAGPFGLEPLVEKINSKPWRGNPAHTLKIQGFQVDGYFLRGDVAVYALLASKPVGFSATLYEAVDFNELPIGQHVEGKQ